MALEHLDSFGYGNVAQLPVSGGGFWTTVNNSSDIAYGGSGSGRWGGTTRYLQLGKNDAYLQMDLAAKATRVVGLAVWLQDLSSHNYPLVRFYDGSTLHVEVRVTSDGEIEALRNATQIGITSGLNITAGSWFFLEVKATIDDAAGVVHVKKNGATVLNLTSADTQNGGNASSDRLRLSSIAANASNFNTRIGDLYILNTDGGINDDFIGECRVEMITPTGNGDTNDFTPSTGSNYENVDEQVPDGDDTFNQAENTDDVDLYGCSDLTSSSGSVHGVMFKAFARRTDVGARNLALGIKHSTTEDFDSGHALDSDYKYFSRIMDENPVTESAFSFSDVNDVQLGVKVVA
jgi:hypothetical protein